MLPLKLRLSLPRTPIILGDRDSKEDAHQRCLLEAKRKVLEQAGVYIESASEVKDLQLTKDKITSFAAAVMQVKDTKEEVGFQQGHMTLTLTMSAEVDLEEVRKQLAARQVDAGMREDVAVQKERLKRLETQLEAMQREMQLAPGRTPSTPTSVISAADLQILRKQAAQGNATAQAHLGLLYTTGRGVSQDYVQARQWYEQAAAQGNAWAQWALGYAYYLGEGVPQDYAKAREWYEKAAAQGLAWAHFALGLMYSMGQGVPQDNVKARLWYERAAVQGLAEAQYILGWIYDNGQGVPQDYAKAREWYEKAAAQGDAGAMNNLGGLYFLGQGVPQDYAQARQWVEQAAAQGNAPAQTRLGLLYAYGKGVPQDDVRAYMWFNVAAVRSTGDLQKSAADNRDKVAHRMTSAQFAEGQRLSQQCQVRQFKGC